MDKTLLPVTVGEALSAAAQTHNGRTCYIYQENPYSFGDMDAMTDRLASRLIGLGLGKGDRIGVIALNQIEWLYAFFAAAKIGAVIVGLSVRYRNTELDYMLIDSKVRAVISLSEYAGFSYVKYFSDAAMRFPRLTHQIYIEGEGVLSAIDFSSLIKPDAEPNASLAIKHSVDADDLLMIIYTSGTTGKPKAAGLTHKSILAAATAQVKHIRADQDDLVQLSNPLSHVGGITCGVMTFLLAGATCELVPAFSPDRVLDMAARNPPTIIVGVPTMLTLLLMNPKIEDVDLGSVRLVITGGSNVDSTLLTNLHHALPNATLMNLYGLSEVSGAIVMTPWKCDVDDTLKSIGKPLDGAELRVVNAKGAIAQPNEVGELWFKGLGVTKGYVGEQKNDETFDQDGWLHTGDLGYVDERGFIYLMGRRNDMYIQGGFNVYPAEIESVIATHPDVLIVAGIGVSDPVLGEVGRYYIVPKEEGNLTELEIMEFCRAHLADYKVPKQIVFRRELPLTPAGKIQKSVLRSE